jgi:hypothetical protein
MEFDVPSETAYEISHNRSVLPGLQDENWIAQIFKR